MGAPPGFQPRLRYVTGTCQFNAEGAGSWRVEVNEGNLSVSRVGADAPPADVVLSTTPDVMAAILRREGHINIFTATLQGRVNVTGDPTIGWAILMGFTPTPAGAGSR